MARSEQETLSHILGSVFISPNKTFTSHSISTLLQSGNYNWLSYLKQKCKSLFHHKNNKRSSPNKGVLVGLILLHSLVLSNQPFIVDKLRLDIILLQEIKKLEHQAFKTSFIPTSTSSVTTSTSSVPTSSVDPTSTSSVTWQHQCRMVGAALGHKPWRSKRRGHKGVRILCLDGGGTRGVATLQVLKQLKRESGGLEMHEIFDMVVGTSTGAIIASLIGYSCILYCFMSTCPDL